MTHDDLRADLAGYAAGTLDPERAEAIRTHLATGCTGCLAALYALPVGLPREPVEAPEPAHQSTPPAPIIARRARSPLRDLLLAGLAVGTAAAAAGWGWTTARLRSHDEVAERDRVHLTAEAMTAAAERDALTARVRELDAALVEAREAARTAESARADMETDRAALEADLKAAQERLESRERDLHSRQRTVNRLLAGAAEGQALDELLAAPGVRLLALEPVGFFRNVRGHVLWHPRRRLLVVYAFGLPQGRYRVQLQGLADTPAVLISARGQLVFSVALNDDPARLREVQIVREPSADPVLAGHVGPRAG